MAGAQLSIFNSAEVTGDRSKPLQHFRFYPGTAHLCSVYVCVCVCVCVFFYSDCFISGLSVAWLSLCFCSLNPEERCGQQSLQLSALLRGNRLQSSKWFSSVMIGVDYISVQQNPCNLPSPRSRRLESLVTMESLHCRQRELRKCTHTHTQARADTHSHARAHTQMHEDICVHTHAHLNRSQKYTETVYTVHPSRTTDKRRSTK